MATAGALHGGPLTRCDTWKAILVLGSFSTLCQTTIRSMQLLPTAPSLPGTCSLPGPTKHGLPDATYNADAENLPTPRAHSSSTRTCTPQPACMFASLRCAAVAPSLSMASILSRLPPMAWLDGGSRSRSWAPELLLATADKQIRADKGRRAAGTRAKKDLPQKVGRRQSPLLVRAG